MRKILILVFVAVCMSSCFQDISEKEIKAAEIICGKTGGFSSLTIGGIWDQIIVSCKNGEMILLRG
jgi:hypothetical protein